MASEEWLSRALFAERVRASPRDAAAWSALLRHDYGVAKRAEPGNTAPWKALLLAFRTALTQLGTDQRRTPAFAQILLDEARAQIYVDAAAARQSFKSVRVMPSLKASWTAWRAALVAEAKLCDADGVRRLLEWGRATFKTSAPEHVPELEALIGAYEAAGPQGLAALSRLAFDDDIASPLQGGEGAGAAGGEELASVGNLVGLLPPPPPRGSGGDPSTTSSGSLAPRPTASSSSSLELSSGSLGLDAPLTGLPPFSSTLNTSLLSGRPARSGSAQRVPRSLVTVAVEGGAEAGEAAQLPPPSVELPVAQTDPLQPSSTNSSFEAAGDGPSVPASYPLAHLPPLPEAGGGAAAEAAAAAAFMRAVATRRRTTLVTGGVGAGFFPTLSPVQERRGAGDGGGEGLQVDTGRPSTSSADTSVSASSSALQDSGMAFGELAALETSINITHTRGGRRRAAVGGGGGAAGAAAARFSLSDATDAGSVTTSSSGSNASTATGSSTGGNTSDGGSSCSRSSYGGGVTTGHGGAGGGFLGPFNVTTSSFGHTSNGLASSVLAASTGFPGAGVSGMTTAAPPPEAAPVPTAPAPAPVLPPPQQQPTAAATATTGAAPPPPSTVKKRKGVAFEVPDYIKNFGLNSGKAVATTHGGGARAPAGPAVPAVPASPALPRATSLCVAAPASRALPPWQPVSGLSTAAPSFSSQLPAATQLDGLAAPPPSKRPRLDESAAGLPSKPVPPALNISAGGDAMMVEDEGDGPRRPQQQHLPQPSSHDDSDLLISPIVLKEAPSILKTGVKPPASAIGPSAPPSAIRFGGGAGGAAAPPPPFPSLVLEDEFTRQLAKAATAAAEAANASVETTRDEDEDEDGGEAVGGLFAAAHQAHAPMQLAAAAGRSGSAQAAAQRQAMAAPVAEPPAPLVSGGAGDERPPSALFDPLAAAVPGTEVVRVNGRAFLKLDCIGRGGSSRVYRVLSQDMVIYALKRVRLARMDASTIAQYSNEIGLLRRLAGHKHIIKLIAADVSYPTKCIHMVMELGQTDLAKMLAEEAGKGSGGAAPPRGQGAAAAAAAGGPVLDAEGYVVPVVDENLLRLMWQQMLTGVQTIHEARIVHGDLKPANFVVVEGILKLIDFGIAKAISNDTTNIVRDTQMGTLNYMSPEAISDVSAAGGGGGAAPTLRLGRASDIWSLGCILYQMVYGRTPFADLSLIAKLHAICDPRHIIPFPPVRNPHLVDVMKGCLTRDPAKRLPIGGHGGLLCHPFLRPHLAAAPAPDAAVLARVVKAVAAVSGGPGTWLANDDAAGALGASLARAMAGSAPGVEAVVQEAAASAPLARLGIAAPASAASHPHAPHYQPTTSNSYAALGGGAGGHGLHPSVASAVRGPSAPPAAPTHHAYPTPLPQHSGSISDENAPVLGAGTSMFGTSGKSGGKAMAAGGGYPPHHQLLHQSIVPGTGLKGYPLA